MKMPPIEPQYMYHGAIEKVARAEYEAWKEYGQFFKHEDIKMDFIIREHVKKYKGVGMQRYIFNEIFDMIIEFWAEDIQREYRGAA